MVDRTAAGEVDFHPAFAAVHTAPLVLEQGTLRLRLFVDRSSLELFAQDGRITMTESIFPRGDTTRLEIFAKGEAVTLTQLNVYPLAPANLCASPM